MRVILVSQCTKNALTETRRIIDQFAERKGDCIWETQITKQGLDTLKSLLRSTARKNTAIACHLYRGHLHPELLWVIGNPNKFNRDGTVPTNITRKDILRDDDENDWHTGEAIALISAIAGLFHDFGKANNLFQMKLSGSREKISEPFRHEWISLLLFKQFIGASTDREWLEKLSSISHNNEAVILKNFPSDFAQRKRNPLINLPPLAKFIGWLILSHHRLPISSTDSEPRLDSIDKWMDDKRFSALWNSPQCSNKFDEKEQHHVGSFPKGLPISSKTWCAAARKAAIRALKHYELLDRDWFQDRFSMHLMRAILMLSDHSYSSGPPNLHLQDKTYEAYANTDKRVLKQKLDEHNIGVAKLAYSIAKRLPKFRNSLPTLPNNKELRKRSKDSKFIWQDKAYDLVSALKSSTKKKGFFGINLASTGCGKTLGNARIMHALSDESRGCRFSIALGLRVLTLQTGDALKKKLTLNDDDIAILIGSQAVQILHELGTQNNLEEKDHEGSESLESLIGDECSIDYEGSVFSDNILSRFFSPSSKFHKMMNAPILVCTIDHLISATEGCRGGKQIAPILRLLTSDLVLDELDDFDVSDLPAITRLVNFAGVFGSKVLLSSATLPPTIVNALFQAYSAGRQMFNKSCTSNPIETEICCAWFDEFNVTSSEHSSPSTFMNSHDEFIKSRISQLKEQPVLRRATLAPVTSVNKDNKVANVMANTIRHSMYNLHDCHHQTHPQTGKKVSIGVVRMANINSMIDVIKEFIAKKANTNYCIHYCIYHSRFPMIIRSEIERILDHTLLRHNPEKIWEVPHINSAINGKKELNHIFVVFATSVAEVGRDHDYDWAIAEPSSMRSLIQLAGRIQRHRRYSPKSPNMIILERNIRGLQGEELSFVRPGFESKEFRLDSKNLSCCLQPSQYEILTAIPRISPSQMLDAKKNLADLEHARLIEELINVSSVKYSAGLWWKHHADWCGELQKNMPFRKRSGSEKEHAFIFSEDNEKPVFHEITHDGEYIPCEYKIHYESLENVPEGIYPWMEFDIRSEVVKLSNSVDLEIKDTSIKFTRTTLRDLSGIDKWTYNSQLGFYHD